MQLKAPPNSTNVFLLHGLKRIVVFLFSLFISTSLSAQELIKLDVYNYARTIVDTMASANMHGRGYVNEGDKIAADYINNEYKKRGLKSFNFDYLQKFNFSINTFPGAIAFDLFSNPNSKEEKLKGLPGQNFLISADAPSIDQEFKAVVFDSTDASKLKLKKFKKKLKGGVSFVIIDDRGVTDKSKLEIFKQVKQNYFETQGVIELVKKLTWEQSQNVSPTVKVQILADSFHLSTKIISGRIKIQNKIIPYYTSQNVIGYVEGSVYPDSFIVFSAHYDHLGQMGKDIYFPGANDNASGCAMLLNLARYYSIPENRPKCSVAFIAFGGEEVGLLGSKYYTEHPLFPLKNIKFLLNMDIVGTGEEGIMVVNGSVFKEQFNKLSKINSEKNYLKEVKMRGKAAISDHYFFTENNVPAFFIYTMGGIKAYHDIYDKSETLPLNEFEDLFKLITKFSATLQN
jgi:aminopeptidase YwaD